MRGKVDHGDSVHMQRREIRENEINETTTNWEQEKMGSMLEVAVLALKFSVSGL